ncbi:hypothetical protein LTR56_008071 [Elasticomyces elasticus]|nr:hypothetical protein LTR56_008071 [Elasticomyces elasticus]KAK3665826.1 hypothetical protein LTR22_003457 [Elasticomyces elasticus]KAK5762008.1 hypothetical protein LTS12_007880 [Elasticomyces elasticus]
MEAPIQAPGRLASTASPYHQRSPDPIIQAGQPQASFYTGPPAGDFVLAYSLSRNALTLIGSQFQFSQLHVDLLDPSARANLPPRRDHSTDQESHHQNHRFYREHGHVKYEKNHPHLHIRPPVVAVHFDGHDAVDQADEGKDASGNEKDHFGLLCENSLLSRLRNLVDDVLGEPKRENQHEAGKRKGERGDNDSAGFCVGFAVARGTRVVCMAVAYSKAHKLAIDAVFDMALD